MSHLDAALSRLDDYVRLRQEDEDAYEEDLFSRSLEDCAPEAAFYAGLGTTLRRMNARGALDIWLTAKDVERVRASGIKAFLWEWKPQDQEPLDIPPDADVVITRIRLPLENVRQVNVDVCALDGTLLKRMPDVVFDLADGALYACCEAELVRTVASAPKAILKVFALTDTERRLIAELPT